MLARPVRRLPDLPGIRGYTLALAERESVAGAVIASGGAPTETFREAALFPRSFEEKIYGVARAARPEVMYAAIRAEAREVSEYVTGRCELGTMPRAVIAGHEVC